MEALRRSAPVPITFEAMAADTDGYFSADHQKIAIRQGMSEVQTVSATVHEIAHSKLHNQKKIQIANDEQYQEIELFDKLGLFSNGRIARDNLPEGVYCYDLYYVAECMEFPNLGEYHDNLSLEEAIRIYQEIPAERMNGIKGIGFELKDGSDYEGPVSDFDRADH